MWIHACGLIHSILVTGPRRVTGAFASNSAENAWWARSGHARGERNDSSPQNPAFVVSMAGDSTAISSGLRGTAAGNVSRGSAPHRRRAGRDSCRRCGIRAPSAAPAARRAARAASSPSAPRAGKRRWIDGALTAALRRRCPARTGPRLSRRTTSSTRRLTTAVTGATKRSPGLAPFGRALDGGRQRVAGAIQFGRRRIGHRPGDLAAQPLAQRHVFGNGGLELAIAAASSHARRPPSCSRRCRDRTGPRTRPIATRQDATQRHVNPARFTPCRCTGRRPPLSETTPHETPARRFSTARFSCAVRGGLLASHARRAIQPASIRPSRRPAGRCRALADGKPDLQGVWGNNTVTPMTRPDAVEGQDRAHRRGSRRAQGLPRQVRRSGRRRDLRQPDSAGAQREGQGRVQADLVRSDHRQLQPVLDGRSRVGQPHVAHHRSARRPVPAADRGGAGAPRRRGRAAAHARARRMVRKIDRCRSAAFPTARRERSRTTTATRRSSSRPTPSCCCRR